MTTTKSSLMNGAISLEEGFYSLELLDDLYTILLNFYLPPSTYFIEQRLLYNETEYERQLEKYLPKAFAMFMALHLKKLSDELGIEKQDNGGWEIWARVTTTNSPSFGYLHVDNDELLRRSIGVIKHPIYGSILYVSPVDNLGGGETAFLNKKENFNGDLFGCLDKEHFTSPNYIFVAPETGRLITFSGDLPHAVMWTHKKRIHPRVTLLANYWPARISSVPNGVCASDNNIYGG